MTISTEAQPLSYSGNGVVTAFSITWRYLAKSDVVVTHRSSAGVETVWVLNTDYTLTAADVEAGGTLTATTAPATGTTLVITLEPPNTQSASLPLGGPFPSPSVEDELDRAAQRDSKIENVLDRTLRVPKTDTESGDDLELPIDSARASKFLAFDSSGKPIVAAGTSANLGPVSTFVDTLLPAADEETFVQTLVSGLTAETSPATDDTLVIGDTSESKGNKMTFENFFKVINSLTADNAPDINADYVVTYDTSAGAPKKVLLSAIGAARNRIKNGGFAVDQRINSATSRADDVYGIDCWYTLTQTAAVTVTQQTLQENGQPYNFRMTQSQAAAQRMGVAQIIEARDSQSDRGRAMVLSARVRISNSQAVRYAILEWTGTADSVTSDVVNDWTSGTYTAGNFFLAANLTVTAVGSITPSAATWTDITTLTGTLGSSVNNIVVFFWTEGTAAQNVTLDIGLAQLEPGAVSTEFEYRSFKQELALCQRYLPAYNGAAALDGALITGQGQCISTTQAYIIYQFPETTRIPPTGITNTTVGDFYVLRSAGAVQNLTVLAFTTASRNACRLTVTVAANLAAGDSTSMEGAITSQILFTGAEL